VPYVRFQYVEIVYGQIVTVTYAHVKVDLYEIMAGSSIERRDIDEDKFSGYPQWMDLSDEGGQQWQPENRQPGNLTPP
jgi:hypothetical protein